MRLPALLLLLLSQNPAELIHTLTHPTQLEQLGILSCGSAHRTEQTIASLADLGPSALPALEPYIAELERGESGWIGLLDAYTRIQGPAALPLLQRLYQRPDLRLSLDPLIARALGITAFLSAGPRVRFIHCMAYDPAIDALTEHLRAKLPPGASLGYLILPNDGRDNPGDHTPNYRRIRLYNHQGQPCATVAFEQLSRENGANRDDHFDPSPDIHACLPQ